MKLKLDFVTNSSTTSFVMAVDGELTRVRLAELMGVPPDSPLHPLVDGLFEALKRNSSRVTPDAPLDGMPLREILRGELAKETVQKLQEAREKGWEVWAGRMHSDIDWTELFFCTDSFEWENEHLYLNGLECGW